VYLDVEKTIQVEWSREDDYFEEKRKFMNLIAEIQTGIKGAEPLPQEFSKTEVVKQQISKKQKLRELQKQRQKESEW
jgi:hypothetical protein